MSSPRLAEAIKYLHPEADFRSTVLLQDDGAGPYVATWGLTGPPPTADEVTAALAAIDAAGPPVPQAVSPLQARKALRQAGLLDQVNALVPQAEAANPGITDSWQYASQILRSDPMIAALTPSLNLSSSAIDNLFRLAATL